MSESIQVVSGTSKRLNFFTVHGQLHRQLWRRHRRVCQGTEDEATCKDRSVVTLSFITAINQFRAVRCRLGFVARSRIVSPDRIPHHLVVLTFPLYRRSYHCGCAKAEELRPGVRRRRCVGQRCQQGPTRRHPARSCRPHREAATKTRWQCCQIRRQCLRSDQQGRRAHRYSSERLVCTIYRRAEQVRAETETKTHHRTGRKGAQGHEVVQDSLSGPNASLRGQRGDGETGG